jgi:hypothetical protein
MLRFRIYIPFGQDIDLLNKAISSVVPQIKILSSFEGKKVVVINNSGKPIDALIAYPEEVEIKELPFELVHAQEANWMISMAIDNGEPFCMTTHTDSELLPGAMSCILDKYEQIKSTRWSVVGTVLWHTVFALYNVEFFETEQVWHDPMLFPFYYMDNHMGRLMTLRGWPGYIADSQGPIILHKRSHMIAGNAVYARKNSLVFAEASQIYAAIWGGVPGAETSSDIYANGTLPEGK